MIFSILYFTSFIISLILLILLIKARQIDIARYLFVLGLLVSFWLLMEACSFFVSDSSALLLQRLKYIAVIPVAPTLLLLTILFIKKYTINKVFLISLYIIPTFSLLSVLTNSFPYSFTNNAKVIFQEGIPIFDYEMDIGFIIHSFYSYLLILITCYLLFTRMKSSPKLYLFQSMFVFIGCTTTFILNVLFVTKPIFELAIDMTPICTLITLLIFYWGVFHLPKSVIVPYARDLVIDNIRDLMLITDNYGTIIDANPAAIRELSYYADSELRELILSKKLIGIRINDLYKHIPQFMNYLTSYKEKNDPILLLNSEVKKSYYKLIEEIIYDTDKNRIGRLYLLQDITEIREKLNTLMMLNEELTISDNIIKDALEGIIITDKNNNIIRVNHSMTIMSGYSKEELIGHNPRILKSDYHETSFYKSMWEQIAMTGSWEGEIWDKKKTGEVYPKWMSITTIYSGDGTIANYIGISSDISKMKKAEREIHMLAYYDPLTLVPNRTLFYDRLKSALSRVSQNKINLMLFYMDLDHFKVINDSLGHDAGDEVLIEVTKRIKNVIREGDTLSRLGGDEFTLIMEDVKNANEAIVIAENIVQQISRPISIMGREITVGISIGIAIAPYDDNTLEGIIRKADSAMYHAKETGRNKYAFSSVEIEQKSQELLDIQLKLKEALQQNNFLLYLQPQMSFINGRYQIIGAEALIRLNHNGEIIPPARFIPVAEDNNLILPISNWVLHEIFRIDLELKRQNIDIELSINISVKQFENNELLESLYSLLSANRDQQIRLVLEITESMFIHNLQRTIMYLEEIRKLGVRIAIDDFGTGYSSLSYLTSIPFDYIKIDKSFIDQLDNLQNQKLMSSLLSMAYTLGYKTITEGIETKEQAKFLTDISCEAFQGYYFCKPIPVKEFIHWYIEQLS